MKIKKTNLRVFLCGVVITFVLFLLTGLFNPHLALAGYSQSVEGIVQDAWQRALKTGVYHFASEILQTTFPAPRVSNFGRSSEQEVVYLEGEVDLPARRMSMSLWQQGGNLLDARDGIDIRIEGDQAYSRQTGGTWQEVDNFADAFAPGGDPMAFLAGATNIQTLESSIEGLDHFGFEIDGVVFARHWRDQLESYLRERGELPLGLSLDTPRQYKDMTGQGEIWIGAEGLPARLVVNLAYPEGKNGDRIEAQIRTDFSGYPKAVTAATTFSEDPEAWMVDTLNLPANEAERERAGIQAVLLMGFVGFLAVLLVYRQSKKLYAAVAITVILAMVLTPLLQGRQAQAFYQNQAVAQAEYEQQAAEQEAVREMQDALLSTDWDPQQDPYQSTQNEAVLDLSARAQSLDILGINEDPGDEDEEVEDIDEDGLIDSLDPDTTSQDSDADGLWDGVEVNRLGTSPELEDSDGDLINDRLEVEGFVFNEQQWYLDPNNADTNGDGLLDTAECPELVGVADVTDPTCADTDGDLLPDLFDEDNDNDGVPDNIDYTPYASLDQGGDHDNGLVLNPFDGDNPFTLLVSNLNEDYPVFVDFQLRPENPDHLSYALNVLDWPTGDTEGQIQRVRDTTFATTSNGDARSDTPDSDNGDMRLIPMMEITLSGDQLPLALTDPVLDLTVEGEVTATLHMDRYTTGAGVTYVQIDPEFTQAGDYLIRLYEGTCSLLGDELALMASDGFPVYYDGLELVELADGAHALEISTGDNSECVTIDNLVNGPYTEEMIDQDPLDPYGISVREAENPQELLAYIPLNVVPDETGGGRVAFSARMVYQPGADAGWLEAQEVRVVWVIQMLTDWCDTSGFIPSEEAEEDSTLYTSELEAYCLEADNRTADEVQIVHTYNESWYLTGLSVREDHGMDLAVIHMDPDTSYDPDNPFANQDPFWLVAQGLGDTFVPGRDCEEYDPDTQICLAGDGLRDISVYAEDNNGDPIGNTTIKERFDPQDPSTVVPEEDRWGVPQGTLRVSNFRYENQDYIAYHAMVETPAILEQFPHDQTVTLLYAREDHYRSAGMGEDWQGDVLTVDMAPDEVLETTNTAMNWAPYRYNDTSASWESYAIDEYWDQLEIDLLALFEEMYPEDSDYLNTGRMVVARGFYVSLNKGLVDQVQSGTDLLWIEDSSVSSADTSILDYTTAGLSSGAGIISIANSIIKETLANRKYEIGTGIIVVDMASDFSEEVMETKTRSIYESIGMSVKDFAVTPWTTLFTGGTLTKAIGVASLAGAVAVVGITVYGAVQSGSATEAVTIALAGLGVVLKIHGMVSAIASIVKDAGTLSNAFRMAVEKGLSGMKASINKFAVIGLVIGIGVTWASFGLTVGLSASSMTGADWGYAIAGAIASTIVAVIFFVIGLIPLVGPLISAIIGLIDATVSLLCSIILTDEQAEHEAAQWFCGGLSGILTNAIKFLIFSSNIMVDMAPEDYDRLELYGLDLNNLVDTDLGFSSANSIYYGISVTNTIRLIQIPANMGALWAYQYTNSRLRSSTFEYLWQSSDTDIHETIERGTMSDVWVADPNNDSYSRDRYIMTDTIQSTTAFSLPTAGINQPVQVFLSEGYAIPKQECYVGVCTIQAEKGTNHYDLGQTILFDIFPATLDEFYSLKTKDGGWALSWGDFPSLRDADGDGWPRDPYDNTWDADGDGLSEWFEAQVGTSISSPDDDQDGLSDSQEMRIGTNPNSPDSDGDGLYDCEEVFHQVLVTDSLPNGPRCGLPGTWSGGWEYVYAIGEDGAVFTTLVSSNPLLVDTDSDGLTDLLEYRYGFNPRVRSETNILTLESIIQEGGSEGLGSTDGFVAPGDTFYYEATVANELDNRYAQGLLDTEFPPLVGAAAIPPEPFVIFPNEEVVISGDVHVNPSASGAYSLTQVAGGIVSEWSELIGQDAQLWLPFDTPLEHDASGAIPPNDGTCSGVCQSGDGKYGDALSLDGSSYLTSPFDPADDAYGISLWFNTNQPDGGFFDVQGIGDRWVYLLDGKVSVWMSNGTSMEFIQSPERYDDGEWHHLAHTFGGSVGGQKLYVDGELVDSGSFDSAVPSVNGIQVGYANIAGGFYFDGLIDDLRIYDAELTASEVQSLSSELIFAMHFDEETAWVDHSSFSNDGQCSGTCPSQGDGVLGGAASFSGEQYLHVDSNANLELSEGHFTIATWILPTGYHECTGWMDWGSTGRECNAWKDIGIFGLESSQGDGYPSLRYIKTYHVLSWPARIVYEYGIRFGFGGLWSSFEDVLKYGQWNHVVTVFDAGKVMLYVNGELKGQDLGTFQGLTPSQTAQDFYIGRSSESTQDYLLFSSLDLTHVDDEGLDKTAEICMAYYGADYSPSGEGWEKELYNETVDPDWYSYPYLYESVDLDNQGTVWMWEDDRGERCGQAPQLSGTANDDDELGLWTFYETDPYDSGTLTFPASGSGLVEGEFSYSHEYRWEGSNLFKGRIDELQIYQGALDESAVEDLYLASSKQLHWALDEAPGETRFEEETIALHDAYCSGDSCPTAGLPGRVNQTAWFEADEGDFLLVPDANIEQLEDSFSVAAWVRPTSVFGVQTIVAAAQTESQNGFGFALNDASLRFSAFGVKDYDLPGRWLEADHWAHVVVVVDGENDAHFYVNGELAGTVAGSSPVNPNTDDTLLVGATTEVGGEALRNLFDGRIDDLYIYHQALSESQIQDLYLLAPVLQLNFDENQGASLFEDDSGNENHGGCTGDECPQVGSGIPGMIGGAVEFDGLDDQVQVADDDLLDLNTFTLAAWVLPIQPSGDNPQELVGKYTKSGSDLLGAEKVNYRLYLEPGGLIPSFQVGLDCLGDLQQVSSDIPLMMNYWNHVAGTFDGEKLRIYVNGVLREEVVLSSADRILCRTGQPIHFGACGSTAASGESDAYSGRLDQVTLYARTLTDEEISSIFTYQSGWVEDRQRHHIVVDADDPTSELHAEVVFPDNSTNAAEAGTVYLPLQDVQLLVTAADLTTAVEQVELGSCQSPVPCTPGNWTPVPQCLDSQAWCPTFDPDVEGRYTMQTRATDGVGNREVPRQSTQIVVDDTPPVVGFDFSNHARIDAYRHPTIENAWTIHLSGAVSDPTLADGSAGSGVVSVMVTVLDGDGGLIGEPTAATINAGTWSLDYALNRAEVSEEYTVEVTAADRVTLVPNLTQEQVDRHTSVASREFQVDADAPVVNLDLGDLPNEIGPDVLPLQGECADRSAPVQVNWWVNDGSSEQVGLEIQCGGKTIYRITEGSLPPEVSSNDWSGLVYPGTACQVILTDSAGDGGVSGTVQVCGEEIASWNWTYSDSHTVNFTANATACDAGLAVAGVSAVDLGFMPNLPGSAFYPEAGEYGLVLALDFDQDWSVDGTVLPDNSGWAQQVTLDTGEDDPYNKALSGVVGAYALGLDGLDDHLQVSENGGLDLSVGEFTQAVWIYPTPQDQNPYPIFSSAAYSGAGGEYPTLQVINRRQLRVGFGSGGGLLTFTTGNLLTENAWNHVAVVFDGTTYSIYINGQLRASTGQFSGLVPPATQRLDIGRGASGTSSCAEVGEFSFTPLTFARQWRVRFNGEIYYLSEEYPVPDRVYPLPLTDFCNPATLQVEYRYWNQTSGWEWVSLGTQPLNPSPGAATQTFAAFGHSAEIYHVLVAPSGNLRHFMGRIDEARIYRRALDRLEIQALYQSHWQPTSLISRDELEDWTAAVPTGLEGSYEIYLRGWDAANHAAAGGPAWQGEADTLAPRISITGTTTGNQVHYRTVVEDFNLTEDGFSSPCGAGVITAIDLYQASWYQDAGGDERLYRLVAECDTRATGLFPTGVWKGIPLVDGSLDVFGGYAYLPEGRLWQVDVSNPARPSYAGLFDQDGDALGVVISGTHAYVADGSQGLAVVDLSDPTTPVARQDTPGNAQDAEIYADHVYLADGAGGLCVIDVADPDAPVSVDCDETLANALGIDIAQPVSRNGYQNLWETSFSIPNTLIGPEPPATYRVEEVLTPVANDGVNQVSETTPAGLSPEAWVSIQEQIYRYEYGYQWESDSEAFVATNEAHRWRAVFDSTGVQVTEWGTPSREALEMAGSGGGWHLNMKLLAYGYPGYLLQVDGGIQPVVACDRIEYPRDANLTEWYLNGQGGLEQGFTLASPPALAAWMGNLLQIELALDTNLRPELSADGEMAFFQGPDGRIVLRYGNLQVSDANGQQVPAHLSLSTTPRSLSIWIDDREAVYPILVDPLLTSQQDYLTSADDSSYAQLGFASSLDGDTLAVGAPYAEIGLNNNQGAVYIFQRDQVSGDQWVQVQKIIASDGLSNNQLGKVVSLSGDTVAVSNDYRDVYIFSRNVGGRDNWGEVKKLTPGTARIPALSLNGDTLALGAPWYYTGPGVMGGGVYLYGRDQGGYGNWGQIKIVTASDAAENDRFGASVSLKGDTLAVGATGADISGNANQGAVYIFSRNYNPSNPWNPIADNWGELDKITSTDGAADDNFGGAVSLSGNLLAVGTTGRDCSTSPFLDACGGVYIFERTWSFVEDWGQVQILTSPDGGSLDRFGSMLSLSGDTLIVGIHYQSSSMAEGVGYIFERNAGGPDNWDLVQRLSLAEEVASVSASDNHLVLGTPLTQVGSSPSQGVVYLYERHGSQWAERDDLSASDGVAGDQFGYTVSVDGDTLAVGAPYVEGSLGDTEVGAVYLFERSWYDGDVWLLDEVLEDLSTNPGDHFGAALSVSGNAVAVGAPDADDGANLDEGIVYLFRREAGGWDDLSIHSTSDTAGDHFGAAVSLFGDSLAVGAPGADSGAGEVTLHLRNWGVDQWGEFKTLNASDGAAGDNFGSSLSYDGLTLVVGAPEADLGSGSDQGAVYVFERDYDPADPGVPSPSNWGEVITITSPASLDGEQFGDAVSLSGDTLAVGAPYTGTNSGAAYLFSRHYNPITPTIPLTNNWGLMASLTAPGVSPADRFGVSVSLDSGWLAIGAPGSGSETGAVYLFEYGDAGWEPVMVLATSGGSAGDRFGATVDLSSPTQALVVGVPGTNSDQGSAYAYSLMWLLAASDTYTTAEDTVLSVASAGVLANDSAGDISAITSVTETMVALTNTLAFSGTMVLELDGSLTYTPTADFNGLTNFTYRAQQQYEPAWAGYFPFDEGSGTITADASGHGYSGSLASCTVGPSYLPDWVTTDLAPTPFTNQAALEFPAGDLGYVDLGNLGFPVNWMGLYPDYDAWNNASTPIALAAWVKPASTTGTQNIISRGYYWANGVWRTIYLRIYEGTYQVGVNLGGTDHKATAGMPGGDLNNWVHLVGMYDRGRWVLYRNGVLVTMNPDPLGALNFNNNWWVGGPYCADHDHMFEGQIDDVRISKRALSEAEIISLVEDSGYYDPAVSNLTTVTINVTPVNDVPVVATDSYTTAEDLPLIVGAPGVLENDSDIDGDPLEAVTVTVASYGPLDLNSDGSFTYTPAPEYSGLDSFTYYATDGISDSIVTTVTLTITPVNDPPVALDDVYTTTEEIILAVPVLSGVLSNDQDIEGIPLTAITDTNPVTGTFNFSTDGSFNYTPPLDFFGVVSFTYHASDGPNDSNLAMVLINVTNVNDPPVAHDDAYTTPEDTILVIGAPGLLLNDNDVDGDPLTAITNTNPATGTLVLGVNGGFNYDPPPGYHGEVNFSYHANDGEYDSNVATVVITVTSVNDVPIAQTDSYTTDLDVPLVVAAPGVLSNDSDPDGEALSAITDTLPIHGELILNADGSLVYTPTLGYVGADGFDYHTTDGISDSLVIAVDLWVNAPPEADNISVYTLEDTPVEIAVVPGKASDPFGDPVSLISVGDPVNGTAVISGTDTVVFTPTLNFSGTVVFSYTVSDPRGLTDTADITVTVGGVNDAPVAVGDEVEIDEGTSVVISVLANDYDPDGQTPFLVSVGLGANGTTQKLGNQVRYTPLPDYFGIEVFTYTISDGGLSATANVTVTVLPINDLPTLDPLDDIHLEPGAGEQTVALSGISSGSTYEDQPLDLTVDSSSSTLISVPEITYTSPDTSGTLSFTPIDGEIGLATISVTVSDGLSQTVRTFQVSVWPMVGPFAYLARGEDGLVVVDLSRLDNPRPVGGLDTDGETRDVVVSGDYAYLADGPEGLLVLDISNPRDPQVVGALEIPGYANGVDVAGEEVYLAAGYDGLVLVDVSDPSNPGLVSVSDTPGYASKVAVSGRYVYVADTNGGLRVFDTQAPLGQATACDTAGNCATVEATLVPGAIRNAEALALAEGDRATSLGVSILNVPPILDSTDPLTITGKAYAEVSSLRYLTVTVSPSGDLIDVKSWANGVVSETNWSATWVLAGLDDGAHSLQAELLAWDGTQAEESLTVTLDTQPPEVSIASLVLTSTNFIAPDRLEVSGLVSDTGGVVGVQVWVAEGVYDAEIEGNDWRAVWSLGEGPLPDNQAYLISAQATDVAGHTTLVSETVTVDLVSPAAVTLSMSSTGIPLEPGDTLRSPSGLLTLDWGLSSDGSGVADYLVEWVGTTTSTEKVIYDSPYPLSASQYLADEGQKVSVRLGIADIYGQTTWESFGPVYVDGHQTPDYVPLDDSDGIYHGWMESGCTLVGVDRRITEGAQANAALGVEQRLYTTWNAEALRLAWTGANWNSDGDLFVYLDTRPGGASTLFDPYLATISNTLIYLPDGFEADIVVWVRDSSTALFLDWAGSGWVFQGALSDEQYAFDPALNDGQTDLYLPFSILGLVAGDSLDLLALASEEGGLRLWAALPNANPLNSELVVNTDFNSAESYEFGLMQVYHWDSLGVGVCPNGSDGTGTAYLDSDLKMSLSLVPTGIAYNLVGDGLFWLQDLLIDSPPADVTSYLNFLNKEVLLLGNGQEIEYTIQYRNQGTQTAKGVFAAVEAQHALFLPTGNPDDMHKMVAIGDIEPGEVGEVTFRGVVDTSRSIEPWAGVLVRIFDATHGLAGEPLEWLWAHHKLDNRGPEFFGLQEPVYLIGADPVELSGYAYDESGVPEIRLKVQPPVGNLTRITCPDDQPTDGYWSCVWDVAASNGGTPPENGDVFRLRLRAKDDLGQLSAETNMLYFMVDTQPPTVTLDLSMTQFFSGQILRGGTFGLAGEVYDNGGVESVSLCSEGECEIANLILAPGQEAVVYTDNPDTPVPINGGTTCGGGEILRTFQVNESFMVAEVRLGFSAEHSRRDDLLVSLRSPLGTIVQVLYDDGISGTEFKNYNVLLSDFEPLGLADLVGDHDLDGLIYDRFGRSSQPLRVFQSRDSAGTWTLSICDQNPTANDGAYLHSQLILVPMDTTSKSGHWYQQTPDLGELDYMTKTISIYGQDVVGNRSTEPLRVELLVDNVPPSITVTLAAPESIPLGEITTILGGRVTDGSPLAKVYLHIWTPDGDIYRQSAAREGARWWFDLEPFQAGEYTVLLSASDLAGNKTTRGPFKITVTEIPKYYFPLVMVRYMPEPRVYEWDFSGVVGSEWSSATISATPSGERFLGQFGRETVFLELPDLQPHTRVTLDFDLYLIRSWDGNLISATLPIMVGLPAYSPLDETIIIGPDIWEVGYGGSQSLLLTTFNNWKGSVQAYPDNYPDGENPSMTDAVAVDSLGYAFGTIPMDSIYHLQFTFDHNEADLILNFGALISEDIHDESWGLDNVRVVVEE